MGDEAVNDAKESEKAGQNTDPSLSETGNKEFPVQLVDLSQYEFAEVFINLDHSMELYIPAQYLWQGPKPA